MDEDLNCVSVEWQRPLAASSRRGRAQLKTTKLHAHAEASSLNFLQGALCSSQETEAITPGTRDTRELARAIHQAQTGVRGRSQARQTPDQFCSSGSRDEMCDRQSLGALVLDPGPEEFTDLPNTATCTLRNNHVLFVCSYTAPS